MADTTYKIPHDTLKKEISKPEDFTPPEELYKKLIATIRAYRPTTDLSEIEKAYKIASKAHEGQKRKSGEPYIIHPLCVAIILAELELDKETIVAGILHDVVEDTVMTREEIAKEFSEEVALLVDGVTKLTQLDLSQDKIEVQAENQRKMILAMAKDIRVILIKLADRLHNLRTMQYQSPAKQIEKSRETMDIYAPLAHRLGISKIKVELDDLSMQYLYPEVYKNLKEEITTRLNASEDFIVQMVEQVKQYMKEAGIDIHFVQDNQSMSTKGVLRGLHFQKQYPQCKLVRAVRGTVFDVAVDLRSDSRTYGKWFGVVLSAENKKQFLIPEGFAHGFLVLSDEAEFCYKVNDFWHPNDEGGMAWNDPEIGIEWPEVKGEYKGSASAEGYTLADGTPLNLSDKDQKWLGLKDTFKF